jgi:hypothetical protein
LGASYGTCHHPVHIEHHYSMRAYHPHISHLAQTMVDSHMPQPPQRVRSRAPLSRFPHISEIEDCPCKTHDGNASIHDSIRIDRVRAHPVVVQTLAETLHTLEQGNSHQLQELPAQLADKAIMEYPESASPVLLQSFPDSQTDHWCAVLALKIRTTLQRRSMLQILNIEE